MKLANAARIMLSMDPKYRTGETATLRGYDAYGALVEETIPVLDWERIESDLVGILVRVNAAL